MLLLLVVALSVGCGKKGTDEANPAPKEGADAPVAETPPAPPRAAAMPEHTVSVFAVVEVDDWDKWKKAFDAGAEARKDAGALWHSVARDDDKVFVHVVCTAASDAIQRGFADAGVEGKPEVWVANDVELDSPKGEKVRGETYSIFGREQVDDFDQARTALDGARDVMGAVGGSVSRGADDDKMIAFHFMVTDPDKADEVMSVVDGKPEYYTGKLVEVSTYR